MSSYLRALATVTSVDRVSPTFVRITFVGAELDEIGTPGDVQDVRIKIVFPPASGLLAPIDLTADDWWAAYLAVAEEERGSMRTYSIRALNVTDAGTEVVVDFVLHLQPGSTGPASTWANKATPGDHVYLAGPRRNRVDRSGIEYDPGNAQSVLLAGDETAAPAIARILEDAPRSLRGVAFIEVPLMDDILAIDAPEAVDVRWLVRGETPHGTKLIPAVLDDVAPDTGRGDATDETNKAETDKARSEADGVVLEELLWETPAFSSLGEEIGERVPATDRYFWIAGESQVVTSLRRHLVRELGIDRSQVAFMGYWRRGVAMRG